MFEALKARPVLRARPSVPLRAATRPLALIRAAAPKPTIVKTERRRKKNKREKAQRRRTRTASLYNERAERTLMGHLMLLIYL